MSEDEPGSARSGPVTLDQVDKSILAELQRDGRMSYADLAPKVDLSPPAVRQRVQRLIGLDVLQIVGVTDPLRLGLPVMAMLGIKAEGDVRRIADEIGANPAVIYLVHTTGMFSLMVEVVCRESRELLDIINDEIKPIDGVETVEPMVYLDIHTHRFNWEVP